MNGDPLDELDEHAAEIARLKDQILVAYQLGVSHRDPPDLRSGAVESREAVQLTDAERSAIADAADRYADVTPESAETAATLRALLSRTGSDLRQTCDNEAKCHSQSEKTPEREHLTDAEREAVEYFAAFHRSPREADANAAATLRGLLERTK